MWEENLCIQRRLRAGDSPSLTVMYVASSHFLPVAVSCPGISSPKPILAAPFFAFSRATHVEPSEYWIEIESHILNQACGESELPPRPPTCVQIASWELERLVHMFTCS